jgi:hypothetical protein
MIDPLKDSASNGPVPAPKMRDFLTQSRTSRAGHISLWDYSRRMLRGEQNLTWENGRVRELAIGPSSRRRNASVTNQLLQPYRTAQELLRIRQPYFDVIPASPSYDNITKAMACQHVAGYWWSTSKMHERAAKAVRLLCIQPVVGFHTFWNPTTRRPETEVISAYDMVAEKDARGWDETAWIAIRHTHTRQSLIDAYPDHADWLKEQQAVTVGEDRQAMPDERVDTWDIYWKDSRKHVVLCNDRYLWEGEFIKGLEPVTIAHWLQVEGELYGPCLIDQLLDLQRRYNHATNSIQDILDAHSSPVWLNPSNSGVSESKFNNAPDNVITYRGTAKRPERDPAPPFSQELMSHPGRTQGEMMDVAGIHGSTYGKRSVGISSGRAIEALAERDEAQLYMTAESLRVAIMTSARNALLLYKAFGTEPSMMSYFDASAGAVIAKELSGTDLADNPEVFIDNQSLYHRHAADSDAVLMELWDKKLIDDPAEVLKRLSFQIGEKKAMNKMIAMSHAQDLLEAVKAGLQIQISPNDDTKTIRDVFMEYARSPQFYQKALDAAEAAEYTNDPRALMVYQREYEVCEYVEAIIAAIDTFGQPAEAYMQAATAKVFPRNDPKPQDQIQTIAATSSPQAQGQMLDAGADMRTKAGVLNNAQQAFDAAKGVRAGGGAVG